MHIAYETQGFNTYLVFQPDGAAALDTAILGMLTNNRIPGLAPVTFSQIDDARFLKYLVSGKVQAANLMEGVVNRACLLRFLCSVCDAVAEASSYMIDTGSLLLDMQYVFTDVTNYRAELICLPVSAYRKEAPELADFFRNIIISAHYDPAESKAYIGELISYLSMPGSFSPEAFSRLVTRLESMPKQEVALSNPQAKPRGDTPSFSVYPFNEPEPVLQVSSIPQMRQPDTTYPDSDDAAAKFVPLAAPIQNRATETSYGQEDGIDAYDDAGERISLFYLLQHYNAENKAKYDAQKKRGRGARPSLRLSRKDRTDRQAGAGGVQVFMPGYAIPGLNNSLSGRAPEPLSYHGDRMQQAQASDAGQNPPANAPSWTQAGAFQPEQGGAPHQGYAPQAGYVPQQASYDPQASYAPQHVGYDPQLGSLEMPRSGANFGDTVYLDENSQDADGTELLLNLHEQAHRPHLLRQRNNERVPIDKALFRIGRARKYSDYVIEENIHIGSAHCHFIIRDGAYYIVDDNSKNHTYIDSEMIQSSVEVKITHGTKIRLADEEFEFYLY